MLRLLAFRYFVNLRRRSVIGVLSGISVLGVAVSTAAMVIVLSAFNGLEFLIRDLYRSWDPAIRITSTNGKFLDPAKLPVKQIAAIPGIGGLWPVLEDNALLRYQGTQSVVRVKGVDAGFLKFRPLDSALVGGTFGLGTAQAPGIVLGYAVQQGLGVPLNSLYHNVQLWYPRPGVGLGIDPASAFVKKALAPRGVFRLEKQYDEKYVFVRLDVAAALMDKPNLRSAYEVDLAAGADADKIAESIRTLTGPTFAVEAYEQQHAGLVKVLRLERFFVYLALTVILLVSSFNIFTALSMLAVEKQMDLATLSAIGAPGSLINRTFLLLGLLISGAGALLGVGIGLVVVVLQDQYGLVSMGMETAIVQEYPVRIHAADVVLAALTVLIVSIAVSLVPARKAAQQASRIIRVVT